MNFLHTRQSLSEIEDRIEKCQDMVDKIEANDGYSYLSEHQSKLTEDIKTMQEYHDYVRDDNLRNTYEKI